MSFQAYLDTITAKTGKSADDCRKLAAKKGYADNGRLRAGMKAGEIGAWLKEDVGLGRGHGASSGSFHGRASGTQSFTPEANPDTASSASRR
jgi:hypothetical protein